MTSPALAQFLWGAASMVALAIGLFFIRFWRQTADRLFLLFSIAFWLLALNWIALAVVMPESEARHFFYVLRLAAFLLIAFAIIDKNRSAK
jgi:hypothetical protein